jgi:hypothetical protein
MSLDRSIIQNVRPTVCEKECDNEQDLTAHLIASGLGCEIPEEYLTARPSDFPYLAVNKSETPHPELGNMSEHQATDSVDLVDVNKVLISQQRSCPAGSCRGQGGNHTTSLNEYGLCNICSGLEECREKVISRLLHQTT